MRRIPAHTSHLLMATDNKYSVAIKDGVIPPPDFQKSGVGMRAQLLETRRSRGDQYAKRDAVVRGNPPAKAQRILGSTESSLEASNYDAYTSATTTINVHAGLKNYANKLRLQRALRTRVNPNSILKLNQADSSFHSLLINHI